MITHMRELNERIIDYATHADSVSLNALERTLGALAEFQQAAAQTNDDPRARALAGAYANFTREVTEAYVNAARELRK
jgi:hypothetical protein